MWRDASHCWTERERLTWADQPAAAELTWPCLTQGYIVILSHTSQTSVHIFLCIFYSMRTSQIIGKCHKRSKAYQEKFAKDKQITIIDARLPGLKDDWNHHDWLKLPSCFITFKDLEAENCLLMLFNGRVKDLIGLPWNWFISQV